jgi:O-antigen/teichoic acid export membrane protein
MRGFTPLINVHNFFLLSELKKRLLKASGYIVLGNFFVGVFGLLTISVIAKNLSIQEFGIFAIIQSYAMTVNGLLNFQTWQTVIKYYPYNKNSDQNLRSLLSYSFKLDILTAFIAFFVSLFLLRFVSDFIGIESNYYLISYFYCLTILFNIEGTITGYFRSVDKFSVFFVVNFFISLFKYILVLIFSFYSSNINSYAFIYVISVLFKTLLLHTFFIKYSSFRFYLDVFKTKIKYIKKRHREIFEFSIFTSFTSSFDLVFKQADVLVVSSFFGTEYAGIFKMLKTIGGLVSQVVTPIYMSIYPIISEKKSNILDLKKFVNKSILFLSLVALCGFVLFYCIHSFLIDLFFGSNYVQYSQYLILYVIPIVVSGIFTSVHPAFALIGYHKRALVLIICTSFIYIMMIYLLKNIIGFYAVLYMLIVHSFIIVFYKYFMIFKYGKK